jgi:hypothetical protein
MGPTSCLQYTHATSEAPRLEKKSERKEKKREKSKAKIKGPE